MSFKVAEIQYSRVYPPAIETMYKDLNNKSPQVNLKSEIDPGYRLVCSSPQTEKIALEKTLFAVLKLDFNLQED